METRPGIYTTEFWLNLTLQVIFALNTLEIWSYMPQRYTAMAQAFLAAAYMVARGIAKQGVAADANLSANYRVAPRASDGLKRR